LRSVFDLIHVIMPSSSFAKTEYDRDFPHLALVSPKDTAPYVEYFWEAASFTMNGPPESP